MSKTVFYKEISTLKLNQIDRFANVIYKNFIHLKDEPKLNHNVNEIKKLLLNKNMKGFLLYSSNGILIGYIIGEIKNITNRVLFYITYFYIAKNYRSNGFGKKLLVLVLNKCKKLHIYNITLTCDTSNSFVHDFYLRWGFMPDQFLRTYEKYDVLTYQL